MGYSLQNQLGALFDSHKLRYDAQAVTEGNNKPDFIFPVLRNSTISRFNSELLVMLGAKSTLKERWRQVLTEAGRIPRKHLCTLEPSISKTRRTKLRNMGFNWSSGAVSSDIHRGSERTALDGFGVRGIC